MNTIRVCKSTDGARCNNPFSCYICIVFSKQYFPVHFNNAFTKAKYIFT